MTGKRIIAATAGLLMGAVALTACGGSDSGASNANQNGDAKDVTLTITGNEISGGKNAAGADWITNYVIPKFEEAEKAKGVNAKVNFQPNGVDDEAYKTKISLDLSTGQGADVVAVDGIWLGEFADAGYIKPLNDVVGKDKVQQWDGWKQIKPAVQQVTTYDGNLYGVPDGTDGRVVYFNKKLFAQAGLPSDWQPKSWNDILDAARKLKSLQGVTPLQINAGTAMGEAATMQGFLPLLQGTGQSIYKDGKWQGDSQQVQDVLNFYSKVYGPEKLGDPLLQQDAKGRDKSFQEFSQNKLGILIESDYLWRSVINPKTGIDPMADRDSTVGWAKIPAESAGKGPNGAGFVSMSGGSAEVINPKTKYPQQAWELLQFMSSADAIKARIGSNPQISARDDVNAEILSSDPLLKFISTEVLPITAYRPALPDYTQVSAALQKATGEVASGKSAQDAGSGYEKALEGIVGGSDKISK
ncbi:extracellular solute-binding protein [Paenarthrobacter sp. DKR-5]|uniref:sugar ABC transporter substrate-binding protein n=1 Tax=Paenarthrobacter sp. DKR-5 TaxID=2835535 RepID=UPI001BDD40DC|nr:extracellular solute-binding protein [Paenarthrobacter sp. DKR-5]MBT1002583.1 extracellular solute-binding protein [Paenarthrobacter sp. DKR-5]